METFIRGSLDELWEKTQEPQLHKLWDLRFTDIEYLPRESPEAPQRFLYATRIGFGMRIEGEGETVGTIEKDGGMRTSALKFWSDDKKSLISTGSGYWKYIPADGGVRFLTWYDYKTRFGPVGELFDLILFRPLMGWATAWSFDRLRLWIDEGVDPSTSLRLSCIHAFARLAIAFVWLYHGLVPKLIFHNYDELLPLLRLGYSMSDSTLLMKIAGLAEIAFAFVQIVFWTKRWPLVITAIGMIGAFIGVASTAPELLFKAFNTVTTNLMLFSLAAIGILSMGKLPSAARCLRRMKEGEQP